MKEHYTKFDKNLYPIDYFSNTFQGIKDILSIEEDFRIKEIKEKRIKEKSFLVPLLNKYAVSFDMNFPKLLQKSKR